MIRLLLREALLTTITLVAVSLVGFVLLDLTGTHDWWGTLEPATRAGIPADQALLRTLPLIWNRRVADAETRTLDDLAQLDNPATASAARARLIRRGTAALPTLLSRLHQLPHASRTAVLQVLATMAPGITGGEQPPDDPTAAMEYWNRFHRLRGLDFRQTYARRQVQRLVDHDSRNAAEQLVRLGTFALPAIFALLDHPIDTDSARRLTTVLCTITGLPMQLPPGASVDQTRALVNQWRAWWFASRLEYETLRGGRRIAAHVLETRYGRWLACAVSGSLGNAQATGRPIILELRQRLPVSVFIGGLGGLIATALVVAFGGGRTLRQRPLRTKLLDLVGALVPGLVAFVPAFATLVELCAAPQPPGSLLHNVFALGPRLIVAVGAVAAVAVLWLRRPQARVLMHAVRHEAESWAIQSLHPRPRQVLRHGLRVGLASLLAPLGLSTTAVLLTGLLVEPVAGIPGMGALTLSSLRIGDAPWILVAAISTVPLWMGGRWARKILLWALGGVTKEKSEESY